LPEKGPWGSSSILASAYFGTSTEKALNAGWAGAGGSVFSSLVVVVDATEFRRDGVGVDPMLMVKPSAESGAKAGG